MAAARIHTGASPSADGEVGPLAPQPDHQRTAHHQAAGDGDGRGVIAKPRSQPR